MTDQNLHQQLLELVYDLLSTDDAAALRLRIETEPEIAAAYEKTQRTARSIALAARTEAPKILLAQPDETVQVQPVRPIKSVPGSKAQHRAVFWIGGTAAALLLMFTLGGYAWQRLSLHNLAADHLRLVVTGPAKLEVGVPNQYSITTTSVTGEPLTVKVESAVYSPAGKTLWQQQARTDGAGRLNVTIPASVPITGAARLEVLAYHHDSTERMQTFVPTEQRRFVSQLALDKPLYQPGETVFYRSLTLGRFGLDVPEEMPVHFEIRDPSGAAVAGSELEGVTERGVGSGAFSLPEEIAGGEYQLVARSLDNSFPEEKRKFFVRRYRLPRLKKDLEFVKDSYTPGDKVAADFSVNRAEGGPAADAALRITATVDGAVVHQAAPMTTATGTYHVEFELQKEIEKGDAQLAVVVDDGGTIETIAKTIPINLGKVEVKFYPEGGDLVAGVENRVYFMARNPLGKPVHIEGTVCDAAGKDVGKIETSHKGMGSFRFTPRDGVKYSVKIDKPADIKNQPELPEANKDRQLVLNTGAGIFEAGQPIDVHLLSRKTDMPLAVTAYCRGVQVGQQVVTTGKGASRESGVTDEAVSIALPPEAGGVVRLTVYDYSTAPPQPVAERLVYRRPDRKLQVRVADHHERYSPGEPVQMSLMVTDEKGQPSPAALGVAVVDDALLKMSDDDTPAMPTHFYLTTEVEKPEDLEKADFYLTDDAKAPAALDLLLGTQGWRRFVEKTFHDIAPGSRPDDQLARLVALGGAAPPPTMFDNLDSVKSRYDSALATFQSQQREALSRLGQVAFFGAVAIVLFVVLVAAFRMATGFKFWVPTLGAATACLIVGMFWMNASSEREVAQASHSFADWGILADGAIRLRGEAAGKDDQRLGLAGQAQVEFLEGLDFIRLGEKGQQDGEAFGDAVYAFGGLKGVDEFNNKLRLLGAFRDGKEMDELQVIRKKLPMRFAVPAGRPMAAAEPARDFDERAPANFFLELPAGGGRRGLAANKPVDLRQLVDAGRRWNLQKDALNWEESAREAKSLQELLERYRFPVREYAHQHSEGEPGVRSDFAETVFWHPLLIADSAGRAEVKFDLSDSVTTYRVLVDAHDRHGRIGGGKGELISRIPFNLEPKMPLEVTAGDRIEMPVAVAHRSAK